MTRVIELKTTWASAEGVKQPGRYTVPKQVAFELCRTNCAEYADGLPPETAVASAPEKAVFTPPQVAVQGKPAVAAQKPPVEAPAAPTGNLVSPPWGKGAK